MSVTTPHKFYYGNLFNYFTLMIWSKCIMKQNKMQWLFTKPINLTYVVLWAFLCFCGILKVICMQNSCSMNCSITVFVFMYHMNNLLQSFLFLIMLGILFGIVRSLVISFILMWSMRETPTMALKQSFSSKDFYIILFLQSPIFSRVNAAEDISE